MIKYSEFLETHPGAYFWSREIGDGLREVLVYSTRFDMCMDTDNSRAIARATVIDDRDTPDIDHEHDMDEWDFLESDPDPVDYGWIGAC